MEIDYYEILEISKTSDQETIKKAFRKLALRYHPDRNQGNKEAEDKFKLINEAYQVLSDEEKKSIYDRYGKSGLQGGMGGFSGFGADFDLGDIFSSFFGGDFGGTIRKKRSLDKYPLDFEISIGIEFNEAIFGIEKELEYKVKKPCASCKGTGSKDGLHQTCPHCHGRGRISQQRGFMSFVQECPYCHGTGEVVKERCGKCSGVGYEEEKHSVKINVPAGVDDGMRMRVSGKGNVSVDGSRGDLYVNISVEPDEHFVRNGNDVYIEIPVFFTQAMLGETITIPTLKGTTELKLPIGAKDKQQFVFENEGVKSINSKKVGRLIAQISVQTPSKLNDEQRELLNKLQASFGIEGGKSSADESVFDKVINWFKGDSSQEKKSDK
ncbi:molecular chaperone DnaJ [Campylobacter sp. CCUG 57310]|uniref:molecular chaperone DnaJ n=1 Tax=Campylobacter sp. CCUG 57310 TaxID=2517362 RepID=UPI0015670EA5|nr:molecular chaperone DnaJ [Campylobacter sp. CCUG 57310]QKF92633.1 DnaK system heat shock co-chaperone [Campylobacter sp. CCUG 57310]